MKTVNKFVLVVFTSVFTLAQAQAMRWYSPSTGHWLSRDPVGERGGKNLYCFVANAPIARVDFLGLETIKVKAGEFEVNMGEPKLPQHNNTSGVEGTIVFRPGKACPTCKAVRMVQTVQAKDKNGNLIDWSKAQIVGGDVLQAVTTKAGWHVDFGPSFWKGKGDKNASIYYSDNQRPDMLEHGTHDGSSSEGDSTSLFDSPTTPLGGWDESFETCARCADHDNDNKTSTDRYLGCVTWGFKVDNVQLKPPTLHPPKGADAPSAAFLDAVKKFNEYYGSAW